MRDLMTSAYHHRFNNCTDDTIKAKFIDRMTRYKTDMGFVQSELANFTACFEAADANQDGRLNKAEYMSLMATVKAERIAEGSYF